MGKHYVINQPRRQLDDATRGNVKLVVKLVASVARARREELTDWDCQAREDEEARARDERDGEEDGERTHGQGTR